MGISGKLEERHDFYFKKAKTENYRARSVYKLKEIQETYHLIKQGDSILELGAAPGSWTQFASTCIGPKGHVLAVDRLEIEKQGLSENITVLQSDILEISNDTLEEYLKRTNVDLVLSDMAPNTSGIKSTDHIRSIELCEKALFIAKKFLKKGGHFVCKVFQGEDLPLFIKSLERNFKKVSRFKPKSSKQESFEIFLVAKSYLAIAD